MAFALGPTAWVLPLRTPTLPPATSTNTVVFAGERVAVVEPATPFADAQRELDDVLDRLRAQGREVSALLVTHHHADHIGYAEALRDRLGVPLLAHPETAARIRIPVDRTLDDGDTVDLGGGVVLEAIHTPGHAPGHLVYRERGSNVAHGGDMVAGEGFIIIDPDDAGDMAAYLASLERLRHVGIDRLVPAHGPVQDDPLAILQRYTAHRLAREAKVLAAVGVDGSPGAILARAYDDTPAAAMPLAAKSLRAHLDKLVADGAVVRRGDDYVVAD